ncbi:MAG: hypothetical protein JRL30_13735 [Deltaproteobacteria bacterium]|nr:hypothetical protein [Deltaproteobacteria bacterium]
MKYHGIRWTVLIALTVSGLFLAGCATLQENSVTDVEGLLQRAGFKKMPADTPKKLAHLKSLPQHRLIHHERDGNKQVLYADATYCICLFVGDETNLQHYRNLEIQQNENPLALINDPDIVTGEEWSDIWGRSR